MTSRWISSRRILTAISSGPARSCAGCAAWHRHRCSQQMPFQVSSGLTFSKMTYLIGMLISGPPQHEDADTEAAAEPAVSGARGETTRFETRPTAAAPAPPRAPPRPGSSTSRCSTTSRASPSRSAPRPPPRPPPRGPLRCRGRSLNPPRLSHRCGAEHLKFLQCSYDSLRWQPRTFLEMAFPVPELVSLPYEH